MSGEEERVYVDTVFCCLKISLTFSPDLAKWHMRIMCSTRDLWIRQNSSNSFWLVFISWSMVPTDDVIASTSYNHIIIPKQYEHMSKDCPF